MRNCREAHLVKREAYLADNGNPDCERRDARYERRWPDYGYLLKSL